MGPSLALCSSFLRAASDYSVNVAADVDTLTVVRTVLLGFSRGMVLLGCWSQALSELPRSVLVELLGGLSHAKLIWARSRNVEIHFLADSGSLFSQYFSFVSLLFKHVSYLRSSL
jgi:hypothetical protein